MNDFEGIIGYTDKLKMLRALITGPLSFWTKHFFERTRSYSTQLYFVDYCRSIIEQNRNEICDAEFEELDKWLIIYELDACDRLNWWSDYICLFEKAHAEKSYCLTYQLRRDDPVFNSYILRQDENYKYVHFLYACDRRYKIICGKQRRTEEGENVERLKRHQQDELTDKVLEKRYLELKRLFEFISKQPSPDYKSHGWRVVYEPEESSTVSF